MLHIENNENTQTRQNIPSDDPPSDTDQKEDQGKEAIISEEEKIAFGFIDDCFIFPGIQEYISNVTGATLYAASKIMDQSSRVAIHWDGGR